MMETKAEERRGLSGPLLLVVIFVILLLVGVLFFLANPSNGYFWAMVFTGLFALVLGVAIYLFRSLSKGETLRIASTGCFWFGVVMLLGSDLVTPDSAFGGSANGWTFSPRIPLLIVVLVIMAAGLGIQIWQASSTKSEEKREEKREEWRRSTGTETPQEERP